MSLRPFLSTSWYRVASLCPRMRPHCKFYRHRYRGKVWHVIQDDVTGRIFRLSPASFIVVGLMDGIRTVDAIWMEACRHIGSEAPSQDEVIALLAQLNAANLLQTEIPPDTAGLLTQKRRSRRQQWLQGVLNLLSVRIPLCDPDRFLERTTRSVQWIFGRAGAALWLLVVLPAIVLAIEHGEELAAGLPGGILTSHNTVVMGACFLVLKLLHELGHSYAVKARGGAVHELGIMLLVLAPVPYVDASAASAFPDKRHRVLVGAAGMIVEVFCASIALFIWLLVESGLVKTIAYDVMLIAGISTVVFNINPLLRLDGYYMLSDALEIPNLAQRASAYWTHLVDKYVLKLEDVAEFEADAGERSWLLAYAPLSFFYRVFVLLAIAMVVASEYLFVGVVLALWAVALGLLLPLAKAGSAALFSPKYAHKRTRAVAIASTGSLLATGVLLLVPLPCYTTTEGVVWLPESAIVRAGINGFVTRISTEPGRHVSAGEPLIVTSDPGLAAEIRHRSARVAELEARLTAERVRDRARAQITEHELRLARTELDHVQMLDERSTARSRSDGTFVPLRPTDLPGRYMREGQELGYVLPANSNIIRAIVSQDDFELVQSRLSQIRVKFARNLAAAVDARIVRQVPGGHTELPSSALGEEGGGAWPVDPRDPHGRRLALRVFEIDLEVDAQATAGSAFGSRAYVRFEHYWEPLGTQAWRRFRQLFLARLST